VRNVAVIMGGRSGEHEVSLGSGREVLRHIDRTRNVSLPVILTPENRWRIWPAPTGSPKEFSPDDSAVTGQSPGEALEALQAWPVDVAFLVLHGPYGEDGRIQGFLDMADIPYTGSGHAASALCMDKVQCKRIMEWRGIVTPEWEVVDLSRETARDLIPRLEERYGYPLVAKTPCLGSSVGMAIPNGREELEAFLEEAAGHERRLLVERYLPGTEVTCAVLDGPAGPEALPPTEIVPKTGPFFDYHAKYTPGASDEITPARTRPEETRELQRLALELHDLMGCRGMSRSDFILEGGRLSCMEVNTIPGMTVTSLLPQAAECAGISFAGVIERLIDSALGGARGGRR